MALCSDNLDQPLLNLQNNRLVLGKPTIRKGVGERNLLTAIVDEIGTDPNSAHSSSGSDASLIDVAPNSQPDRATHTVCGLHRGAVDLLCVNKQYLTAVGIVLTLASNCCSNLSNHGTCCNMDRPNF